MRLSKHGKSALVLLFKCYICTFFVDSAYLSSAACEVLQPTAWIPLIDANKINGCMQVRIALSILRLINPSLTQEQNFVTIAKLLLFVTIS